MWLSTLGKILFWLYGKKNPYAKTPVVPLFNPAFSTWFGKIITYLKIWFISFHKSPSTFLNVVLEIIVLHNTSCGCLGWKIQRLVFYWIHLSTCIIQVNFFMTYFCTASGHWFFPFQLRVCIILFTVFTAYFTASAVLGHFLWSFVFKYVHLLGRQLYF